MPIPPSYGGLPIRAVGIPWYRRGDYGRILRTMSDGHLLPKTHADWLRRAEALEQQIKAQGGIAERVYLDPRGFADWCRARGLDVDAEARMRFATEAVAERNRDQS
jgi:hypothetical protein